MEYLKNYGADPRNTLVFVGLPGRRDAWTPDPEGLGRDPHDGERQDRHHEDRPGSHHGRRFPGHSDRRQLMEYVKRMDPRPERIITNHGDENKCLDLASSIYKKFKMETDELRDDSPYLKENR